MTELHEAISGDYLITRGIFKVMSFCKQLWISIGG
jgi:hypothetical protein